MQLNQLSATLCVSPQLKLTDLVLLKEAGITGVICNRPDGEEAGQPSFQQLDTEARRLGLQARYQPVDLATITPAEGVAFHALLAELPGPTVAYCRTGKRSATLWALPSSLTGTDKP